MQSALEKVRCFHQAIGAPISPVGQFLPTSRFAVEQAVQLRNMVLQCRQYSITANDLLARLALDLEELAEWVEAHIDQDFRAVTDALGDRLYVLLGDAVAVGCPLEEAFEAVHTSNMTKVRDGVDACGKALKGSGYQSPRLN